MVPADSDRIPRVPPYSGYCLLYLDYPYETFMLFGRLFQNRSSSLSLRIPAVLQPRHCRNNVGLGSSLSLAATLEIDVSFFSSSYLDVSVQRVSPPCGVTGLLPAGLSHSDICGSNLVCKSPRLFAAYHVLLRLQEPRHPLLSPLITFFRAPPFCPYPFLFLIP